MSTDLAVGKLTPELINMFCNMIAHGNYVTTACKAFSIPDDVFRSWMRTGKRSSSGVYRELYDRVLQADAAAEVYAVETWRNNFDRDTRAAPNFLARRYPERWGERKYIQIAVDKELEKVYRVLQQRLPEDIFVLVMTELASVNKESQYQEVEE